MKITHIKKETDGVIEEEVHINLPDLRYPSIGVDVEMTLAEANLFSEQLSKKLAAIPF